jgi:hypothetical protein
MGVPAVELASRFHRAAEERRPVAASVLNQREFAPDGHQGRAVQKGK